MQRIAILGILMLYASTSYGKKPVCFVKEASGDVRYRSAQAINWRKLPLQKQLYPGDVVFTRLGASLQLEYIYAAGSVELPEQTLFRINETLPTFTKLRRRFGIEKTELSSQAIPSTKKTLSSSDLFERKSQRHQSSNQKLLGIHTSTQSLSMHRESSLIKLETPTTGSQVLVRRFPTTLAIRVSPEFMGQKYFAYLWREQDPFAPIWTGFSQGEFSAISVPEAGSYQLQVISEDESMSSDPIIIHFLNSQVKLSEILDNLHDKRTGYPLIFVE